VLQEVHTDIVALVDSVGNQRDDANAAMLHQQQHTSMCDELCDLQSRIGAARDELVSKNANLMTLQQHNTRLAQEETRLQAENLEMSTTLQEIQTVIAQHESISEALSDAIEEQRTTLRDAENAVSVSQHQNTAKSDEMIEMQQKTEALQKKYSKSQKGLAKVQLQTKEATEAHAIIQARIEQDSAEVLSTQNDLEQSVLELEAALVDHEAETARHLVQQAQQVAQCNEMQTSVDSLMHNKQKIIESIEVLSLSNAEYEQKLH